MRMLVWYIGECMVSILNINCGIKEPTHEYLTSQLLIFGGYWVCKGERIFIYLSYCLGLY